jgi:hypothetical protein
MNFKDANNSTQELYTVNIPVKFGTPMKLAMLINPEIKSFH